MGRQIQICTTDVDNVFFERYLRSNFECTFFQSSAPSFEKLEITTFSETSFPFSTQIFIWNKVFPWIPDFRQTVTKEKTFYIANTSNAPIIEFNKTLWKEKDSHGRIYWTKYFSGGPIQYDLKGFESFYNTVTEWFVKNSKGKIKWAGVNIYYFEDAWKRFHNHFDNGS